MSWISGLADKAEHFLTTLDQTAADKLQKKKSSKPTQEAFLTEVTTEQSAVGLLQRQRLSPPPSPTKKWLPQVKSAPSMVSQSQDEEKLIDFLNDSSTISSQKNGTKSDSESIRIEEGNVDESEKQMLKNEVRVLNNELSLLLHRTRAAEKEAERLKSELQETEQSRISLQDEVKGFKLQIETLELQNNDLITEKKQREDPSAAQAERLQLLLQEVEVLKQHQDNLALSLENKSRECVELEFALQQQHEQADSLTQRLAEAREELARYRAKAQRTLSDKEALISQLRANNSDSASVEDSFHTELEQLRQERQQLSEELSQTSGQLEGCRSRLVEAEQTLARVREVATRSQEELQERVTAETHKRRILEDDFRLQTQELRLLKEELTMCRARLGEREAELRAVRSRPPPPAPTLLPLPGDIETRLSSLTKTLIQKQTALEAATTERNQLHMQLEELEHKHREHLLMMHQAARVGVVSANDTDDAKAQVPSFMMESPFDTGVARRVKRAYSSLDAVSIRTGVFLRRYPLARSFVVLYVVLLHSLVLMVLYSRTPENAQK